MKTKISVLTSAVIGVIFGVLSNFSILKGLWLNLVVWAVVGILVGVFIYDKRFIRWSGNSYGFFITLSFLISGFQGTPDKIVGFSIFSIILSIIGALCGWCLVFVGNWIKKFR